MLLSVMLMASSVMVAQENESDTQPQKVSGYYRLTNPGFGDGLSVNNRYDVSTSQLTANNAGNIIQIETGELWSFAQEVEKLNKMIDAGLIDSVEYTNMFTQSMTVDAWKGGYYPVTSFRCQGVDYVPMIKKLADYADDAIEAYLNDEIPSIYEKYRNKLTLLCIFASDVINPSNLETVDTFRAWAENYLTRWRGIADFNMYLHAVYSDPVDETTMLVPTGEYYITFKTPCWIGNMQKAQTYINNMVYDDGSEVYNDKMDLWADSKVRMLRAIAKDYPEGSAAYNFLHQLLGTSEINMQYIVGETEEGGLYIQPLPDTFGTNGVVVTADDIAKCTWMFNKVNDDMPFAVQPNQNLKDAEGNYYTTLCTDFAYEVKSAGVKAYYATEVNKTGEATLVEIEGGKVPAQTPVVIKSLSADMKENILLPVVDDIAPISGNVLEGTLFASADAAGKNAFCMVAGKPAFGQALSELSANSAFYTGEVDAISQLHFSTTSTDKMYNLQGQSVDRLSKKGIYVVNGKKVVR